MHASFVELRKKSGQIIRALERNESVAVYYRGKIKAIMKPAASRSAKKRQSVQSHKAFGMWSDRGPFVEPSRYVRTLRQGRFHAD